MSKAILIMDMSERCSMCEFLNRTDEDYCYCGRLGFDYQVNDYLKSVLREKPNWCPLKDLPERKEKIQYRRNGVLGTNNMSKGRFNEGWNACIDELLKGDEAE